MSVWWDPCNVFPHHEHDDAAQWLTLMLRLTVAVEKIADAMTEANVERRGTTR